MAQQWRILVVEGDEALSRGIVSTLAQDGYSVRSVATGGEAIRILWTDEHHLVIGDRALPDTDGFDLLHWIRSHCPNSRMMMLATPGAPGKRMRALESGAVAYFEKPIDLRLLKLEVRRLLQQTGFSANLDSFDLLDVIQIINMSRKSIALVVHTGLEEQGMLGFRDGELVWAEYGTLRGEEAFFALAAYKNGMVTQQPWNGTAIPNVTQPLSRLILQALQYRSKYEAAQQLSGEYRALSDQFTMHGDQELASTFDALLTEAVDDRPFVYVPEAAEHSGRGVLDAQWQNAQQPDMQELQQAPVQTQEETKQWWQESSKMHRAERSSQAHQEGPGAAQETSPSGAQKVAGGTGGANGASGTSITPSTVHKTPVGQRTDLPSWLMDQPTQFEIPALRHSSLSGSGRFPVTPIPGPSPAEWRPARPTSKLRTTEDLSSAQPRPANASTGARPAQASPVSSPVFGEAPAIPAAQPPAEAPVSVLVDVPAGQDVKQPITPAPAQPHKRNYPALVSALQTVGYSLPGFIASAIVGLDGQPIAQVVVDDLDISGMCANFSALLRGALRALDGGTWGQHEDTIITSATHHILLRMPANATDVFQVLVTTRETDPVESLDVLASVEGAIISAL